MMISITDCLLFTFSILWEGKGVAKNAPEPDYDFWVNPARRLATHSFRDTEGSDVQCANFQFHQGPLGVIMASMPNAGGGGLSAGISEFRACWGEVQIPLNMPNGINRLLYEWVSPSK